jgi:hypothetical protein
MTATPNSDADLVAELVRIGSGLEEMDACVGIMEDPACSGWNLMVAHGGEIPQAGLPLICQAAQSRPSWLDPSAVDLSDPLAKQLLELARSISKP